MEGEPAGTRCAPAANPRNFGGHSASIFGRYRTHSICILQAAAHKVEGVERGAEPTPLVWGGGTFRLSSPKDKVWDLIGFGLCRTCCRMLEFFSQHHHTKTQRLRPGPCHFAQMPGNRLNMHMVLARPTNEGDNGAIILCQGKSKERFLLSYLLTSSRMGC